MTLDLSLATTVYGPLKPEVRQRLISYARYPSPDGWDDIKNIVISGCSTTVWMAIAATVPGFPSEAPRFWTKAQIPTGDQIRQAIAYATR